DGIRDKLVTGVQTCALPIFALDALRIRMLLGIACDADLEVADLLQPLHEGGGILVTAGMRAVFGAHAGRRIAAQRHDVADAGVRSEERRVGKEGAWWWAREY